MNKAIYQKLNQYFSRTTSRRDFIQAVTALGLTGLAAESLLASVQQRPPGAIADNLSLPLLQLSLRSGALLSHPRG